MSDRLVWITGASSGIGKALAERMARDGWTVAVSARSKDALEKMAETSGGKIHSFPLDVTDEAASKALPAEIEAKLGPISTVVLAAGYHIPVDGAAFDPAPYRQLMEINYMGVVHALAGIVPLMTERRRGHVAIVSSVAGYAGLPTAAAYGATKAALNNMTEALKFDFDRVGIKLQLVCPGFVRTPLTDKNPFPMPMLMEVEDAAEALYQGLRSSRFEITFPKTFAFLVRRMSQLPYSLYFGAVKRGTKT